MRLVMIDNYDSFTYNLAQLLGEFAIEVLVRRHDQVDLAGVEALAPDWICLSPGPKTPREAGVSAAVVERFAGRVPILGVCLGMQVINEVYGGRTARAPLPVHGKVSLVSHGGGGVLVGLPSPLKVARYHSLQCLPRGDELIPLARAEDGVLMALRHRDHQVHGVQFHPESFLSQGGLEVMANFLRRNPAWQGGLPGGQSVEDRFPRWRTAPGLGVAA